MKFDLFVFLLWLWLTNLALLFGAELDAEREQLPRRGQRVDLSAHHQHGHVVNVLARHFQSIRTDLSQQKRATATSFLFEGTRTLGPIEFAWHTPLGASIRPFRRRFFLALKRFRLAGSVLIVDLINTEFDPLNLRFINLFNQPRRRCLIRARLWLSRRLPSGRNHFQWSEDDERSLHTPTMAIPFFPRTRG